MAVESAESQPLRANRMSPERIVRLCGLSVVLLFPLLSLLQLRDPERPWREAARRTRPSVLALYQQDELGAPLQLASCGLLIGSHPGRVVVPGSVVTPVLSLHGSERFMWTPFYTDVHGEFTLLEARGPAGAAEPEAAFLVPSKLSMDPSTGVLPEVEAALVAPAALADEPLWVGVLHPEAGLEGRPGYVGAFLTPLSSTASFPAGEAWAGTRRDIDPALRGAPFVDATGKIVALLLERGPRGVRALPVAVLAPTLAFLQLQAAK